LEDILPTSTTMSAIRSQLNGLSVPSVRTPGLHICMLHCFESCTNSEIDDSAIRRIDLPHLFLTADAIMITLDNVVSNLVVYPAVIKAHLLEELPFMATENILMKLVKEGGDRQKAHEEIRVLSHQASDVVKRGGKNDLIQRIKQTEFFEPIWADLDAMLDPKLFIGRCPEQVIAFCGKGGEVQQALEKYQKHIQAAKTAELTV
jgi:adenylosuccinate lyase